MSQVFRPSASFANNAVSVPAAPSISQYIPPAYVATGPSAQYESPQNAPPTQFISQPSQYVPPFLQPPVYTPTGAAVSSPQNQGQQLPQPQRQRETIISSNIYIHSAPEETEEIFGDQANEAAYPIRKNYRILFVKAPTHNIRFNMNSVRQALAANEEKTVIYVLSKKPDVSQFQSQLSAIQTQAKTNKPEVYFIKYKTQAEANRAQQEIQEQYHALGGSTSISDEGFAPITSVIGGGAINGRGSNILQTSGNNQQNFIQSASQGTQGSASNVNLAIAVPNLKL